jgi:hypothetical protein
MKITIRTNPEIVIDVDSISEEKKVEPVIIVPETKTVPDAKPEPKVKVEKKGRGVRHCKKCGEKGHRSDHCLKAETAPGRSKRKS